VRLTGIEPVRPKSRDFKSLVSTYFTTVAWWAPRDLNPDSMDYESTALTN